MFVSISSKVKKKWYHRLYLVFLALLLALATAGIGCIWFWAFTGSGGHDFVGNFGVSLLIACPAILTWVFYRALLFVIFGREAFRTADSPPES